MLPALDSLRFGPFLDVAAATSAGADPRAGLENQDNFLLIDAGGDAVFMRGQRPQRQRVPGWPAGHVRVAVLDGMGGHSHGREAAEAVAAGLLGIPACASLAELAPRLDALHRRLQGQFSEGAAPARDERRPGSTLTMLELPPGQAALLYHVGDSRLYEIAPQGAVPLTVDHVPATALAIAGALDEQAWWRHVHGEHRSQIAQAFILGNTFTDPGLDDALFELSAARLPAFLSHLPDRRAIELRPGALYLLATDGFWACADPAAWVARWPALMGASAGAHAALDALFGEMQRHPPPNLHIDNLTAIVLRCHQSQNTGKL